MCCICISDDRAFLSSAAYPKLASAEHCSLENLRTLVRYAANRGVRVIPELDMRGM